MTTYPSSSLSPTPALTDAATLDAALDCLLEHVPLKLESTYFGCADLCEILLRAASRHDSIEHTAQRLDGVPSGNGIRYHLDKLDDMATLALFGHFKE